MSEWYVDFFNGLALESWRKATSHEQTRSESDFLLRELQPGAAAELLDVPCGMGRHAVEFASRGYRITGVDLSSEFLDEARRTAGAAGVQVDWRNQDMRELPWTKQFDAAYCVGNSFAYLDHSGNRDFLHAVSRTLKPGSRFALETGVVAEAILPTLQPQRWFQLDDIYFLLAHRYDTATSVLISDYTFLRGGVEEKRQARYMVYTSAELQRLLEEAGFRVLSLYGGYDGQKFAIGSGRFIVIAERRASPS